MTAPEDSDRAPDSSDETFAKPGETRRDPTARFTPGTMLAGRYRLVAPLGKGGMGEVYRADDVRLGQPVALKFLAAALASDKDLLERLKNEVSIGRQISHPNVCRLYDIAEANGHHFLVMEYVDGEDLASLLRRIGRLPADKALEIARGLCAGLAAAHDKGVIHRDLKPANIMIDGRGRARIADFGLAAPAGASRVAGLAGTVAYMAPEQLAGEGASLQSDVFALGLVLYEMFTGRRVFDAKSIEALKELHAEWKPINLSGSDGNVAPEIQRVILRCLARDPAERPASAQVVQAALPGGDPLQAAFLTGETPSPEMVAAASKVGDLRPAVAWTCLIAALLGLWSITILSGYVGLFRRVPLPKAPEALADRARDLLTRLGYGEAGADSAYAVVTDFAFLDYVAQQDPSPARWEKLRTARPGPILFFYRQSPRVLVSTSWFPKPPWAGPPELGIVWLDDPPLNVPGMTRVVVDPLGRLTSFAAVPPRFHPDSGPGPNPDWSAALTEAGFDPAHLQPSAPHWAAPVDSDRRMAWEGAIQGQPDVTFHIEAAAYRGRLVYFEMRGPWVQPPPAIVDAKPRLVEAGGIVFCLVVGILAWFSARRNLRLGRGDRRGAQRLATFTFASMTLAQLSVADHTTLPTIEFSLLLQITGPSLVGAFFVWHFYMAAEPMVRRRWPHTLISWNRLLAGRFRDPLVGRDVLVGVLAGMALALAVPLGLANVLVGRAPGMTGELVTPTARVMAYVFFLSPWLGVFFSTGFLFMLCLFRALVRRTWLAGLLLSLAVISIQLSGGEDSLADSLRFAILSAMLPSILLRFGLLSSATLMFTFVVLGNGTLTLDWSAWYAGRSFAVLGFFVALLAAAFYTSLGGKPLFGKALIED